MTVQFSLETIEDFQYYTFTPFKEVPGVIHAFTTRRGGVSKGNFSSLNMALHVGDEPESVLDNRVRACRKIGINARDLVAGQQVHKDRVEVIRAEHKGRGADKYDLSLPETDALITNETSVPLSSYYADCVPLFLLDPVQRVIGLAHAGWRGTVLRIGEKTVQKMNRFFGTDPADCLAAIAPSIGPCCYEVDYRVITELKKGFSYWQDLVRETSSGKYRLDLWETNYRTLTDAGLKPENIITTKVCTCCHNDVFFSYRAGKGNTGRMASLIMLT
ncbi:peptidoglycan editing factor PgeF [Desulfolucanica intricata]|uniref:peptidoglycan editing factor PgeF n=1 Tax=Desulfolucanica intricata TaxID=1285191 RepID=UPI00082D4B8B|nr:peptidoglycan editing factor PgeF [Desulfolucanica intricata]